MRASCRVKSGLILRTTNHLIVCEDAMRATHNHDNRHNVLKVWATVKIRGTRVPQNAIVPVGRPRPYFIIILKMRFIPKASLRASSQITASSYILERHL